MPFRELTIVVAAGLVGPLLAATGRRAPPAIVGQVVAGIVVGPQVLGWVRPDDPFLAGLAAVGLALLMFVVGTHLPVRDRALRAAVGPAVGATLTGLGLAGLTAVPLAAATGLDRPVLVVALVSSCSAAVALPVLQAHRGQDRTRATAWITLSDVVAVLLVPLGLSSGGAGRPLAGLGLVVVGGAVLYVVGRALTASAGVQRLRQRSRERGWGLDLRVSLLALFALAWLASEMGTSVLLAGFAAGAVVALLGEPRRVAEQLVGVGEGFAVPFFFVHLGTQLDVAALPGSRSAVVLAAGLAVAAVAVHLAVALLWRLGAPTGLLATAQVGVPSAVVAVGLDTGRLSGAEAAAVTVAMGAALLASAVGGALLGPPDTPAPATA